MESGYMKTATSKHEIFLNNSIYSLLWYRTSRGVSHVMSVTGAVAGYQSGIV